MMENLSHTIRKFNRFELKYLVALQQAEQVKSALKAFLVPDENGSDYGSYTITNLYYDSPDLKCYWEKENGLKFRRKLRIRHYQTGEPVIEQTPVFVEIKQRLDRVTQKRRALLSYGDALRLCNDHQIPDHAAEDSAFIEEVFVFGWQNNLRPMSIVSYDRQAFVGTEYDVGLRVTFDTALAFQAHPLHLHEQHFTLPMLSANQVVMEVKINERMPYWLTELIAAHNLKMIRISKYCRSIDAAWNMPAMRWNRLPAESAQEILSSTLYPLNISEQISVEKHTTEDYRGHFQHSRLNR